MMCLTIKEVTSRTEQNLFVRFPDVLFQNCEHYIPPIRIEEHNILFGKNPAHAYCDTKCWLAYRNGVAVGRIAVIINHRANELWNTCKMRFGWFDFIEDIEVCKQLLQTAENYAKQKGLYRLYGPTGYTDMDRETWIIQGFDQRQSAGVYYNFPYYITYIKQLGYSTDCEWLQYRMPASQPIPQKVERINAMIMEKYNLKLLEFTAKKEILPYAKKFFRVLNQTFKDLYEYVPLTDIEIDAYAKAYFTFLDPHLVKFIVDKQDEIVAFAIALPDLTQAYKKAKGKLYPIGWYYLLKALKKYESIDLLLNGVRPDWQKRGIHSIYHVAMNKTAIQKGLKWAYSNPQIVNNIAVKVWENNYEAKSSVRRACFAKNLAE